jgi:hypothetical protein
MKKMLAVVSLALTMPLVAEGVEFQTPGSVGIGGAGVARNNGALTSYWNPAGAAFSKSTLAVNAGAGFGIRASDGLTENIDLLSTIDFDNVKDFNTTLTGPEGVKQVGDVVKTLSILNDINTRQGNIAINVIAPVSFSIKNISFGIYGGMEGYVMPVADFINISPNTLASGTPLTVAQLATAVGTGNTASGYFSAAQLATLTSEIAAADGSVNATELANAIDSQLKDSSIDPATALSTMTQTLPKLTDTNANTLNKNTTSVMTKAFQYIEIPLSYGHPFDIGKKGKLGLGITGKVIKGTVYQNEVLLVNGQDNVDAKDIINDITENKKSSSAIGIDIGALYKYENWLNIGLVAKNINSPKFEAPDYFTPKYNTSTDKIELSERVAGSAVELKPQIRTGVAIEPVGWMTLAADLDLSENDTVAPGSVVGSSIKSRNFGGGFEVKPASWLKVRGGAYKNLAQSNGSVLTAGFKLFLLDVDGAMATNTFTIDGNELPREVKVNASMSFSF